MTGLHHAATTRRRIVQIGLASVGAVAAVRPVKARAGDPVGSQSAEAPAPEKLTPEAVQYQPTPKDWQKCLFCTYFQAPDTCGIITGKVSPQGWCTRFALLHE
jgi:hypothetical protein